MNPIEYRWAPIEYRADEDRRGPGRLRGVLVRYGERRADGREVFRRGALEWPASGIVLRRQHDKFNPILRALPEVRGDEVVLDVELPDTAAGRDAAVEVRAGLLRGLSVEFRALVAEVVGGVREIRRAELCGAGLVDAGAYGSSGVEVRGRRRRRWL